MPLCRSRAAIQSGDGAVGSSPVTARAEKTVHPVSGATSTS